MNKLWTFLYSLLLLLPVIALVRDQAPWLESSHQLTIWGMEAEEIKLADRQSIGQTFQAETDNLSRLAIRVHRGGAEQTGQYIFTLQANPTAAVLRQGNFTLDNVFRTVYFSFVPIENSAGQSYYWSVRPAFFSSGALGFFKSQNDLPAAQLYINHQPQPGDLVFQTYYYNPQPLSTFLPDLFKRLSQYKPTFFKIPYLYIYWLVLFGGLVYLISPMIKLTDDWPRSAKIIILSSLWLIIVAVFLYIQSTQPHFYLV